MIIARLNRSSMGTEAERYRVLLISTLANEDVKRMRMTPMHSLAEAMAELNPVAQGYILPRGAALLPVTTD